MDISDIGPNGRARLVEEHLDRANKVARSLWFRYGRDGDHDALAEYRAEAAVAVCEAAERYSGQDAAHATFWTFAEYRVRGAIVDYIRSPRSRLGGYHRSSKSNPIIGLLVDENSDDDDEEECQGRFKAIATDESFRQTEWGIALRQACRDLTAKERFCVDKVYLAGWSQVEVSDHMGVDESRVSQILSVARDKMRQRINGTVKPKAEAPSAARKRAFLVSFRETQNIPAACRANGISRGAPHRWRATDMEFDREILGVLGQTRPTPSKTP